MMDHAVRHLDPRCQVTRLQPLGHDLPGPEPGVGPAAVGVRQSVYPEESLVASALGAHPDLGQLHVAFERS